MQGNSSWPREQGGYTSKPAGRKIQRDMEEEKDGEIGYQGPCL